MNREYAELNELAGTDCKEITINHRMGLLDKAVADLSERVEQLEHKLGFVLIPGDPVPVGDKERVKSGRRESPLEGVIEGCKNRVLKNVERLENILDRLPLEPRNTR